MKNIIGLILGFLLTVFSVNSHSVVADFDVFILEASQEYGVDANLIRAIMQQESGGVQYNSDGSILASSYEGCEAAGSCALGLMQVIPTTAEQVGFTEEQITNSPQDNIRAGTAYLAWLSQQSYINGDLVLIAAAYNAGPGNVQNYNGVPPFAETINYVQRVASNFSDLTGIAIDTSSVPSTDTASPGSPTSRPSLVQPTVVTDNRTVSEVFEDSSGVSSSFLKGFLTTLIIVLSLLFSGVQVLIFWMRAIESGETSRTANFIQALIYSARSFLVSLVLINLVLNT